VAKKQQMTIGTLIVALDAIVEDHFDVVYDFEYTYPTTVACWRGDYSIAALGWLAFGYGPMAGEHGGPERENHPPTVATLLTELRESLLRPHEGWKGGQYKFYAHTPLYVANPGNSGGTAIVAVKVMDDTAILQTRHRDDWGMR
jgi:hypothetical protein